MKNSVETHSMRLQTLGGCTARDDAKGRGNS
jgi:hypothetical protein